MNRSEKVQKLIRSPIRNLEDYTGSEIASLTYWVDSRVDIEAQNELLRGRGLIEIHDFIIAVFLATPGTDDVWFPPYAGYCRRCRVPQRLWYCRLTPYQEYGPFTSLDEMHQFIAIRLDERLN